MSLESTTTFSSPQQVLSVSPAALSGKSEHDDLLTESSSLCQEPRSSSPSTSSISINDLPFEVLAYIFQKCLEKSTSNQFHYVQPDDVAPPFIFLFVCRRWRAVALESRLMWSQISVPLCKSYCLTETINPWHSRHINFLSQSLSFSGTIPLHIQHLASGRRVGNRLQQLAREANSEDAIACINQQAKEYSRRMLLTLVAEERRWESLDIALQPELFENFVSLCDGYAEDAVSPAEVLGRNLQHLKIRLEPNFTEWRRPRLRLQRLFQWIEQLPSLKSLCIEDSYCIIPDLTTLPLGRFDTVTFGRKFMLVSDAYRVLLRCGSQVTNLALTCADFQRITDGVTLTPEFNQDPTTLNKLQRLSLSGLPFGVFLLNYFNMPHLVSLEITNRHITGMDGGEQFLQRFFRASQCPLERLSISSYEMTAQRALSFLQIPALRGVPEVEIGSIPITAGYTDGDGVLVHIGKALLRSDLKVDCMIWAKLDEKHRLGYQIGWKKSFKDNSERFQFQFKNGEFTLKKHN